MLTQFEKQVLALVARIPEGRVATYALLAKAISRPRAVRAVGSALGKNPNLVTVPCHRIVRSNGTLGGYRLGVRKKKALLESEGVHVSAKNRVEHFLEIQYHF